jgi:hypothetical protein
MVWRLNEWQGGSPAKQVAQAKDLGLTEVCLKVVDGRWECWGSNSPQNCELLPGTINALRSEGIGVSGWGWTWGGRYIAGIFRKSVDIAHQEGVLAGEICEKYALSSFWVDAEKEYVRDGMAPVAEAYMLGFESVAPDVNHFLCSYRFPLTYQRKFPVHQFGTYMEGWAPQVYWIQDNRDHAGAIQLEISFNQYQDKIRELPYIGVAPTYVAAGPWTATGLQLRLFFEKAVELGCAGVSIWDLPKANAEQLLAIKNFTWPGTPEPPPDPDPEKIQVGVVVPAGKVNVTVREV